MRNLALALGLVALAWAAACTASPVVPAPSASTTPGATPYLLPTVPAAAGAATPEPISTPPANLSPAPRTPHPASRLRRLTEPGCCTQPFWSYDSRMVLYVDRPAEDQPVGLWGVDVTEPEAAPVIVSQEMVLPSGGGAFSLQRDDRGRAVIERTADGQRWTIDTGGGVPAISPDGQWVLWSSAGREGPYEQRSNTLYLMSLARSESKQALITVWGGGYAGWLADGEGVLVVGRPNADTRLRDLSVVTVPEGRVRLLLQEELIANIQLAPDGKYVLCTVYFSGDTQRDGVWLLGTSGEEPRKMRFFGAYQWRDARHILYVPLRDSASDSHVFRQYEVLSRENIALTDPESEFFSIAGDDWVVSPDGKHVAFVDSRDLAIWVLELGD